MLKSGLFFSTETVECGYGTKMSSSCLHLGIEAEGPNQVYFEKN
jgi:hypothetical protein